MSTGDRRRRSDIAIRSLPRRPSLAAKASMAMSRALWRRRAQSWNKQGSLILAPVIDTVVAQCGDTHGTVAVDLGCGSGQLTFPLARTCAHIVAVDIDAGAIDILRAQAATTGITNVQALVHPIETLDLPPECVDLVVSNYALHHLRDADKIALVARAVRWLRPGGRLVIGDMMFGRGADPGDRAIIAAKVHQLAVRGPGGWWRIVKNAWRFMARVQERPLRADRWETILGEAGLAEVTSSRVVAEACVVSAQKPPRVPAVVKGTECPASRVSGRW